MAQGALTALREQLTEVITPVTLDAGYYLERVYVSRVGRRHRVQVVVDHDNGVGLDSIADLSRAVSTALDAVDDSIPGEYVLEVSSPGVDRPLTEPRHWRRSVGRLVRAPVAGGSPVTGRVLAADGAGVTLAVDDTTHELSYARLGTGRVQVELGAEGGA